MERITGNVLGETLPGTHGEVPPQALAISLLALAVAGVGSLLWPESLEQLSAVVWLLALVPSFLLAYHKGWMGAAYGLAGGMTLLILLEVVPNLIAGTSLDWRITAMVTILMISVSLGAGAIAATLHRQRQFALDMAYHDPLTGLPNRRVIDFFLSRHFAAAARGQKLAVVMFDIDNFKAYNDRHGHRAGDAGLLLVGEILSRHSRLSDACGRVGGEEFLSVLPGEDPEGAFQFAERVREAVARESGNVGTPFTISAGVAGYDPSMETLGHLVDAADRALYEAKSAGRNRSATLGPVPLPRADAHS